MRSSARASFCNGSIAICGSGLGWPTIVREKELDALEGEECCV